MVQAVQTNRLNPATGEPSHIAAMMHNAITQHQGGQLQKAESIYQAVLRELPHHPDALHNLGVLAHQAGNYLAAIDLIERAINVNPRVLSYYINRGEAYRAIQRTDAAVASFMQALTMKPNHAPTHNFLGLALQDAGKLDEAVSHYRQALALNPAMAEAYNNLGNALSQMGQMEDAVMAYEKALEIKPDFAMAHRHLAMCSKVAISDRKTRAIKLLLDKKNLSNTDAAYLYFALGKIYDENNAFKKAFEFYQTGNQLKRRGLYFKLNEHKQYIDSLITTFSKDYFQNKKATGNNSQLPVFIVGMPRSGTTLVNQILTSHPQVHAAGELNYFTYVENTIAGTAVNTTPYPACMPLLKNGHLKQLAERYLVKLWEYSTEADRITDKMPDNFLRIGLIKTVFPNARIIHCQRHPLDTCLSIYFQYFEKGNPYAYDLTDIGTYYVQYLRLMRHWRGLFKQDILEIGYEDLVGDQEAVSRRMVKYLGLDWDDRCLKFYENNRPVQTASSRQVRLPMYTDAVNRWHKYKAYCQPLIEIIEKDNQGINLAEE